MFAIDLFNYIQNVKKHFLWLFTIAIALVITKIVTGVISLIFNGMVTIAYLIMGLVASLLAASVVTSLMIFFLGKFSKPRQDNKDLTEIINACPIPIAINDIANNVIMLNREFTEIYGYTIEDIPTLQAWWPKAYPDEDYRQWVKNSWADRLKNSNDDGSGFVPLKVKVHCKNGVIKSVMATATHLVGINKRVNLFVLYDITQSASTADAIAESRNILQSIIETIPLRFL
jgi:PAS domain S-box-containing protein